MTKYLLINENSRINEEVTSKFPDFLTHFIEQMMMTDSTRMRATPVGLARPGWRPKRPGVEVSNHVHTVNEAGTLHNILNCQRNFFFILLQKAF